MRSKKPKFFFNSVFYSARILQKKFGIAHQNSCQMGCDEDRTNFFLVPERRDTDLSIAIN